MNEIKCYHQEIRIISIELNNGTTIRIWENPFNSTRVQIGEGDNHHKLLNQEFKNTTIKQVVVRTEAGANSSVWEHNAEAVTEKI